jgi:competence protein ComEC
VREGGRIHVIATSRDGFAVREWLLALGERARPDAPAFRSGVRCDKEGCSAQLDGPRSGAPSGSLAAGARLVLDRTANAVEEDCGRVAILVSPLAVPERCRAEGHLVFDREALERAGSVALYLIPGEPGSRAAPQWRVVTAREPSFARPWTGPATRVPLAAAPAPALPRARRAPPRLDEASAHAPTLAPEEGPAEGTPADPSEVLP